MINTHDHNQSLCLRIPIHGEGLQAKGDPWLAGRTWLEARQHIFQTLGHVGGLREAGSGQRTGRRLAVLEASYDFFYEDLVTAVNRFAETQQELDLPEATSLTHWERFPDGRMLCHDMIRWTDGKLDPFFTSLSDRNLRIKYPA